MQFSSIWPIDRTLLGATTLGQSGPGSDSNGGILHIPPNSSITETSPSDCFVSYLRHLQVVVVGGSYPSAEMQSVYSTAPTNWAIEELMLWESYKGFKFDHTNKWHTMGKKKVWLVICGCWGLLGWLWVSLLFLLLTPLICCHLRLRKVG